MYKKTYPELIDKTLNKKVLLLMGIRNTHGHYACKKKSTYTTSHSCRFGTFILRHD